MEGRLRIEVGGIVQGVGFRPFVYRIAKKHALRGYVKNSGNSVDILVMGEQSNLDAFLRDLKREAPPLARIDDIALMDSAQGEYRDFSILESIAEGGSESVLPPDVSICPKCLAEVRTKSDRRHGYPFTICVDCGARFSIIEDVPYDRARTSMVDFAMCSDCTNEYQDPRDRRFHAEPTCCPKCGPSYFLYKGRSKLDCADPILEAARKLEEGYVVAIMGVGGTHLACKLEDDVIARLRKMFRREEKPFAIMARDLKAAKELTLVNEAEAELLASLRRPIVVLNKRNAPRLTSPGLSNIGIMLPYSALHHLLFDRTTENAFVMTSCNLPGEPMFISHEEVLASGFSDYSLVHNRRIVNRVDDSVVRVVAGNSAFIRRSRGYVPEPIGLAYDPKETILGVGAELNVTACLLKGSKAFPTQYIGDTTKIRTLEYLGVAIERLLKLTKTAGIDVVAIDMHPIYATRRFGEELAREHGARLLEVQHHFAHAASLMAEHKVDEIVALTLDGAGYGSDGSIWGGEVIYAGHGAMERCASLEPHPMPGGDLAAVYPARMVAGILSSVYSLEEVRGLIERSNWNTLGEKELELVLKQLERKFNAPLTTSTGRVLDCVSVILGACRKRTYEGEPAMKLEALAAYGEPSIEMPLEHAIMNGREVLKTGPIVAAAIEHLGKQKRSDIAASVQDALARGLAMLAVEHARKRDVKCVGISGGVAYNEAIVSIIKREVEANGLELLTNALIPPGDGGISLGQCHYSARFGSDESN